MTSARVTNGSAGSFLDPPTYPSHEYAVETDIHRRSENRGSMSLVFAASCDYIDPAVRAEAQALLDAWHPPALDSPEIHDWIAQMLGYFRGCYRGPDDGPYGSGPWAVESLTIDPVRDPVLNADDHAGVHFIRRFYPDWAPTADDFAGAYWGSRPDVNP